MIATVVFFAEEHMFEGMLVSDMWAAAMGERAREVFVRAGARLEDMEFMGGKGGSLQEGVEEARSFRGIQDECWGYWRVIRFAFIPESGLCLWYCFSKSGARTKSAGSHVLSLSGLPFHLMRYWSVLDCP